MSTTTNAQRIKAVENFIKEVKIQTSTAEPTKVALTPLVGKFRVSHYVLTTLRDMEILKYETNSGGGKLVQWAYGAGAIDISLAEKVYEKAKQKESNIPSRAHRKPLNKPTPPPDMEFLVGKNAPIEVKSNAKPSNAVVVIPPVDLSNKDLGVVFGYKQLQYMSEEYFKVPTDVVIDGNGTHFKIGAIKFKVEDSNLAVSLYRFESRDVIDTMPEECLVFEKRVTNTVVGLKKGGGDSKMNILHVKFVPVKDPYKLS